LDGKSGKRDFYGGIPHNHSFYKKAQTNPNIVDTLSLKDFIKQFEIEQIDFLKLDCEGAEFPILLNAGQEVFDKITTISMEFHDIPDQGFTSLQLIRHLKKHNFEIVKYVHETDHSARNLNFGKIIATKFSNLVKV
jgi:Methyltransferase FkbM domain